MLRSYNSEYLIALTCPYYILLEVMRINVSVVVTHSSKALLMQRSLTDDYFPGAWGIPGGYMEPHELHLEETAIRETMEELGIRIKPGNIIANNRNNDTNTLYIVILGKLERADDYPDAVVLSTEANDFKWVGKESLDGLTFTPYTRGCIEKALSLA